MITHTLKMLGIGALLGATMVLIWELAVPNEIGLMLKLLAPFVVFSSAIAFGFFGFLGAIIVNLAYITTFLNADSAIYSLLSTLTILIPVFFVSIMFHIRIPYKNKYIRFSQGHILFALGLISIAVFFAILMFYNAKNLMLQSVLQDYTTSTLMAINGTADSLGMLPIPVSVFIDFIPAIISLMWIMWIFFMFLLAYRISIIAKLYTETDKQWQYKTPSFQFYMLIICLIASGLSYFFFKEALFFILNVTAIFTGLFFYAGLVWIDIQTSKSIFLRIGFWVLFFLLMFPIIVLLILIGILEQFKFFSSLKIWEKK